MKVIVRTYSANATEEIVVERDCDIWIEYGQDGSLRLGVWGTETTIALFAPNGGWRAAWIAEDQSVTAPEDLSSEAYADDEGPF